MYLSWNRTLTHWHSTLFSVNTMWYTCSISGSFITTCCAQAISCDTTVLWNPAQLVTTLSSLTQMIEVLSTLATNAASVASVDMNHNLDLQHLPAHPSIPHSCSHGLAMDFATPYHPPAQLALQPSSSKGAMMCLPINLLQDTIVISIEKEWHQPHMSLH